MREQTEHLVSKVEQQGRMREDDVIVNEVRELWNWQHNREDCDVELRIGSGADVDSILVRAIKPFADWTVRFMNTMDGPENQLAIALVYHPDHDISDTLFY